VEALPRVVLVGPPSAGKSTLFNALLGRARAVVDEAPGTTRDVLEEPLRLSTEHGPAEVMLQDLAGLDHAAALLDRDIQSVAQHAIAGADLILHLAPPGHTLRDMAAGKPVLRAVPKADLDRSPSGEAAGLLAVSGVTGQGLDALKTQLAQRLGDRAVSLAGDRLALQPRHEAALRDANRGVRAALDGIDPDATSLDSPECVAGELRMALDALAGLGGELTPDDVIGRVFATFCVGK
jgi:tRNA modification GTPase